MHYSLTIHNMLVHNLIVWPSHIHHTHAAHELRAWLLHYSPVVLVGYLEDDYYQHHLLLVEAVYLLLKDMVTDRDIIHSEQLFKHYVYLMSPLYGKHVLHTDPYIACICITIQYIYCIMQRECYTFVSQPNTRN